jgi:site-specific recombinase XerD
MLLELMGHSSIVTTMRYIHATDQGKRGAIIVVRVSQAATSQVCHKRKAARHSFVTLSFLSGADLKSVSRAAGRFRLSESR